MKLSEKNTQDVIALCQSLVQAKSISGEEENAVLVLKRFMLTHGFEDIHIDAYGSITGCIKGKHAGPKVLFDGHLDTVPASNPQAWSQDPFAANRVNGKIYGRGTSDMKGAVAAMATAVSLFADKNKRDFAGELHLSAVVHEECFEGIAAREMSKHIQPDLVIIGEPSNLDLKIGQRGRAEIIVETFGVPAHSGTPQAGVNAVLLMTKLIAELEHITPPQDGSPLGQGVSVLTDIISTPYPGASVVPSHCRATYDRRLLVGESKEDVLQPFNAAIDRLAKTIPNFKAKVGFSYGEEKCYTGQTIQGERFFPGWCAQPHDAYVQKAHNALKKIGIDAEIAYYPFCTNGSHYAGEAHINTIGFGPSPEVLAHITDEYIEEKQLIKATEGYVAICDAFLTCH